MNKVDLVHSTLSLRLDTNLEAHIAVFIQSAAQSVNKFERVVPRVLDGRHPLEPDLEKLLD